MQALDTFLRQATDSGTVPGAVVYVASHGQMVWHQAYGAAALTPQYRPMQCNTLFDIASLTKVVATTSLLLLAHHEGVCQLDAPCSTSTRRHAGPLSALPPCANCSHTLVASRPGGPCIRRCFLMAPRALRTPALQHVVTRQSKRILQEPMAYPPGVQTLYSDLGFILLADIVETCYQQPLDRLFRERVAQPLGLHCTGYRPLDVSVTPASIAHRLCCHRGVSLAGPRAGGRSA